MVLNQEYIHHWLSNNHYLSTIWDTLNKNWQHFWNSDLLKELTKPEVLKYFALSAFLGVILPPLVMIGWRMFNRRKSVKNNYTQIENESVGSFNSKIIESINGVKQKEKNAFDSLSSKNDHKKGKKGKKHAKVNESKETESATLLNEPKKELKKKKSKNEMDTTRINDNFSPTDFKLDEHDIEEISHMELHGKLKSATLRARADKLEEKMSAEEKAKEQQLKMEQLEKIFALMKNEGGSKFGINNKEELMDQFKFYSS